MVCDPDGACSAQPKFSPSIPMLNVVTSMETLRILHTPYLVAISMYQEIKLNFLLPRFLLIIYENPMRIGVYSPLTYGGCESPFLGGSLP